MIARVFPTKTSMSPDDEHAYFDAPDMFTPDYDEVHISVCFTWDIPKAERLKKEWERKSRNVRIGGPAIDGESRDPMTSGMYLKRGVTITSRGCPKKCSFCIVRNPITEFESFPEGNIVQDNNLCATSKTHWDRVMLMLRGQKRISIRGIDKYFLTEEQASDMSRLSVDSLWLACDGPKELGALEKAANILKKHGFKRYQLRCYVLIGKNEYEEVNRLQSVFTLGFIPFAQLFRDPENKISYSKEYKKLQKQWSRPAIIKSMMGE